MATKSSNVRALSSEQSKAQLSRDVKTRLNKGGNPSVTKLTVIFDSDELTREFAMRGAVIAMQALYRDAGKIPPTDTVSLSELKKRSAERGFTKPTAESTLARMQKLDDDAYRGVLQNLGMKDAEIKKLLAARGK